MEYQIDPQKVVDALSQRIAALSAENATLAVLLQDAMEAHSQCPATEDGGAE